MQNFLLREEIIFQDSKTGVNRGKLPFIAFSLDAQL